MGKRNYTHVKELLPAIQAMVEAGMTQREIAEHYGFDSKLVVKKLLERSRQKEKTMPKARGRKPAKTLQEYKYENKRLKMEAYFKLTQSYGITPSISRRGNPYDNVMAENFFLILKTECIYRHKPQSLNEANEMIDRYIDFYHNERIQLKTGVAPLTLRHSA